MEQADDFSLEPEKSYSKFGVSQVKQATVCSEPFSSLTTELSSSLNG